jgi:hypothetical protein
MLPQLQKLVLTKEGLEAVQSTLVRHIENYDFLGTYHYAYMLGELDCEPVIAYIINSTTTRLQEAVNGSNYQNCLMWSRFLGELYKYELIKRAILIELLDKFLKTGGPDSLILNLICTVLETCEHYLDSKKVAIRNQVFLFLVDFKVPLRPFRNSSSSAPTSPCSRNSKSSMSLTSSNPTSPPSPPKSSLPSSKTNKST